MIGIALAGLMLAASVPAQSGCPIERAAYAMRGGARLTASFRDVGTHAGWPGRLAFGVRSARTNRTFWFLFDRGAARRINLISSEDVSRPGWRPPAADGGSRPLGEMPYLAANARLEFDESLPAAGTPAPRYILLPGLPERLAHRASPPESVPLAFFELASCRGRRPVR